MLMCLVVGGEVVARVVTVCSHALKPYSALLCEVCLCIYGVAGEDFETGKYTRVCTAFPGLDRRYMSIIPRVFLYILLAE